MGVLGCRVWADASTQGAGHEVGIPNGRLLCQSARARDTGVPSARLAVALTGVTPRVIFVTELETLGLPDEVATGVKRSDVKVLFRSRLLAVRGEGEVEKVLIRDLDEDDEYELFVDAVVLLEN